MASRSTHGTRFWHPISECKNGFTKRIASVARRGGHVLEMQPTYRWKQNAKLPRRGLWWSSGIDTNRCPLLHRIARTPIGDSPVSPLPKFWNLRTCSLQPPYFLLIRISIDSETEHVWYFREILLEFYFYEEFSITKRGLTVNFWISICCRWRINNNNVDFYVNKFLINFQVSKARRIVPKFRIWTVQIRISDNISRIFFVDFWHYEIYASWNPEAENEDFDESNI